MQRRAKLDRKKVLTLLAGLAIVGSNWAGVVPNFVSVVLIGVLGIVYFCL